MNAVLIVRLKEGHRKKSFKKAVHMFTDGLQTYEQEKKKKNEPLFLIGPTKGARPPQKKAAIPF